jgi:nucleotide-binding universal stress UspA family protein
VEVIVKLLETDKHHVAEAIIEESKRMDEESDGDSRYKFEAIVLASHKRGAIKEFFLGSVANYVLHHANIAVVVQRMK